MHKEINIQVN